METSIGGVRYTMARMYVTAWHEVFEIRPTSGTDLPRYMVYQARGRGYGRREVLPSLTAAYRFTSEYAAASG